MRNVQISPVRFKELRGTIGIGPRALARTIGSSSQQIWRLDTGRPTSFDFLARLVRIFDVDPVADIIADDEQRKTFVRWYVATHINPPRQDALQPRKESRHDQ